MVSRLSLNFHCFYFFLTTQQKTLPYGHHPTKIQKTNKFFIMNFNNLKIKYYNTPSQLSVAIEECLEQSLYVSGWSFYYWFNHYSTNISDIIICYDGRDAVGCCVRLDNLEYFDCNFGTFVKPSYRKKGIGKKMVKRMIETGKYISYASGISGSLAFYHKCFK